MTLIDYSPPASPTLDQQRDALQKGLGRAMQWALQGRLGDDPLLSACLQDQRFDVQVEDSRGDWLWQIIDVVGAADRFRVPILHAIYELSDYRSAGQLCELARCYAQSGDAAFRSRLYEIVEQKPIAETPWLGEREIIALDGEQAFLCAARIRGRRLATHDWDWDDDYLVRRAIERFGGDHVNELLENSNDPAISGFARVWRQETKKETDRKPTPSHRERMRAVPFSEIISAAETGGAFGLFSGWGKHAAPTDLEAVLRHLWTAQEPKVISSLLGVFYHRALPVFDARLIGLCTHSDAEVRRRAFGALEENTHPLIREFVLTELEKVGCDGRIVGQFINNYQRGDEQRILESLELPDDECERHWLLMRVIKVLEKNTVADSSQLGVITYATTPCQNCRFHAVQCLHKRQVVPNWLEEERRYDSNEDCRKMFEQTAESTEAS